MIHRSMDGNVFHPVPLINAQFDVSSVCYVRRFCNSTLADWKDSLTPEAIKPEMEKVQPIMVVYGNGEIHRYGVGATSQVG